MKNIFTIMLSLVIFTSFAQDNDDPDLYYNQAKLSYKMRKLDRSIQQCNNALELDSTHYEALLLKGMSYYDKQEYDSAIAWVSKSITAYTRNDEAYFERGIMYFYLDKYKEAATDFTAAGKIRNKRADYFYFKGLSLKEIGEIENACKAFKRARKLKINEKDIDSLIKETCPNN